MPELPEVETVVRQLRPVLVGKRITDVVLTRKTLRMPIPKDFIKRLRGQMVRAVERRAKYILIELGNGDVWITHLGMSGMLSVRPQGKKHDHAIFTLSSHKTVVFNDPRRFGFLDVVAKDQLGAHKFLKHLGLEPLDRAFTARALYDRLQGKTASIKSVIMDQKILVGVGNIYASEALYDSFIHPQRRAMDVTFDECTALVRAIKSTLRRAIKAGGSTIQLYHNPMGESGYFQHRFKVYDRENKPCARHKSSRGTDVLIARIDQQGRSTYFCPCCQTLSQASRRVGSK